MMTNKRDRFEVAKEAYRAHRGKDYDIQTRPEDPPVMAELLQAVLENTYGTSWCRPGLDVRTRSFISMTITASLGAEEEFKQHVRAALKTGITKEEMVEMLFQYIGYLGVPRSSSVRRWMRDVWREHAAK